MITVVIFVGEKHLNILPVILDEFLKYHNDASIYIVTPSIPAVLKSKSRWCNVKCILDSDLDYIDISRLRAMFGERATWYFQQLAKLTIPYHIKYILNDQVEKVVIWDGDTVPLRRINFFENDLPVLNLSKTEYHWAYFITNQSILGGDFRLPLSCISQYMPFNLNEWSRFIRDLAGSKSDVITLDIIKDFINVIILNIGDTSSNANFSEQELLASWRVARKVPFNTTSFKLVRYGSFSPVSIPLTLSICRVVGALNVSFESGKTRKPVNVLRFIYDLIR